MTQPAFKARISTLTAVVWRNAGDTPWYSVRLTRGYKTDDGWRESDALGYDDLLAAAKLLDQAHTWIGRQLDADRKARKQSQQSA